MTGGLLNAAMLVGLLGAAIPLIIHLLNRRRDPIIEWGAMRFLDVGRRARQRLRLTEFLLLLVRTALLAAVALALARPYLAPSGTTAELTSGGFAGAPSRDVVLVIDTSAGMDRDSSGTTPRAEALAWARRFVTGLAPGDSVAVLASGDRVRPVVVPPSFDSSKVIQALDVLGRSPARGASDLPSALAEAFGLLERTQNPARDVILLTDGQRTAWRPGEPSRWALLRDLRARLPVPPRVWCVTFGPGTPRPGDPPNASVGEVSVSRGVVTPGLPLNVTAEVVGHGPGPLTRTAELRIDGRPLAGSARVVGPLPPGGRAIVTFRATLDEPGARLLTVGLSGGADALPADDEASATVTVAEAVGVLIVDGEPGREPLTGEADFLRAALAPEGDDTPQALAEVVTTDALTPESLRGRKVLMLANVDHLTAGQSLAVGRFVAEGGGVLVAPGDRVDPASWNAPRWMPAGLGEVVGDPAARRAVAHPAPPTFSGPVFAKFGEGESPPLAKTSLFTYRRLEPKPGASVSARLDTGDPWAVERTEGRGRVLVLAGPVDAEGGTLPVNPDFVPLVHEWALDLAGGAGTGATEPGAMVVFEAEWPGASVPATLPARTPSGAEVTAAVNRSGDRLRAVLDEPAEPGVYRLSLPDPPGGFAYAIVPDDPREADPAPLEPADMAALADGWPLVFADDPENLPARIAQAGGPGARREVWRALVLLALVGLCVEIHLTRKLAKGVVD
ncbi:MAG: VWA domain-containing protein [Isosphaeraceae bacterium]